MRVSLSSVALGVGACEDLLESLFADDDLLVADEVKGVDGRIILEWYGAAWAGSIWIRIGTGGGLL